MKVGGVEVSEEQVRAWADEAEAGYDVEMLRKFRRPVGGDSAAKVVPVRMDAALLEAVDGRANHDHTTRSEIIRAALRAYIA